MLSAATCVSDINRLLRVEDRVLLATDFDGTLCPLVDKPAEAAVPAAIIENLLAILASKRAVIAVISRRALQDLSCRLPLPIVMAGNCGLEIRSPFLKFEHPEARRLQPRLARIGQQLSRSLTRWEGAWVEDKTFTATVHYREVDRSQQPAVIRAVRTCMAAHRMLFGMRLENNAIDIHPRIAWHKGTSLIWIKRKLRMDNAVCICIGNDPSDELMFRANAGQINIKVGRFGHSLARYSVADVFEVAALLAEVAQVMRPVHSEHRELVPVA